MEGRLVRILPLDPDAHWRDLWHALGGPAGGDVWTYMPIGPFGDEATFRAGMHMIARNSPDWVPTAILDKATGRALGTASYMRMDPPNGSAEVGCIAYGEGLKRRPGATEAMLLMGRHIFEGLGYRRYEWKCDAANAASRSAALRLGFTFEGTFRQHMVVKGRNRDTAWFSITDEEWPAIAAAMEGWLDPVNFSQDGQQVKRLQDFLSGAA